MLIFDVKMHFKDCTCLIEMKLTFLFILFAFLNLNSLFLKIKNDNMPQISISSFRYWCKIILSNLNIWEFPSFIWMSWVLNPMAILYGHLHHNDMYSMQIQILTVCQNLALIRQKLQKKILINFLNQTLLALEGIFFTSAG